MRRRLYFMLPDVAHAKRALRELLLARIEVKHMGRRSMPLGDLPEANFLQKTDVIHGAGTGMIVCGFLGVIGGGLVVLYPPSETMLPMGTMLITGLLGSLFGIWVASMAGTAVPNSRHAAFQKDIAAGKMLMMVDVPSTGDAHEVAGELAKRVDAARLRTLAPFA